MGATIRCYRSATHRNWLHYNCKEMNPLKSYKPKSIGIVLRRGRILQENVTFVEIGYVKAGVEVLKKD